MTESENVEGSHGDDATLVEPRSSTFGCDATVLEPGVQRAADQGCINDASITVGSAFLDFRVVEPLRVISAEADLWILQKDATKYVLKLYRFGIEPKSKVADALAKSGTSHFVKTFTTGKHGGRSYEIQEYIEHGSLEELIARGVQQNTIREVLKEICEAIKCLHALKIIHRDIKPSNILVRSTAPVSLVLSDFGISSLSDLSIHHTSTNRTASYSAPEALTGHVKFASDWWSVGVILLEMLEGRHPFSGIPELAINYQLATRGIPVQETVPLDWQLPAKGLLTRDPEQRWGEKELAAWLEGERNIPIYYTEVPSNRNNNYDYRPYKFDGKDIYDLGELAVALAENWTEGVKRLGRGSLLDWVKQDLKNHDLATQIEDVSDDNRLDSDTKMSVALLVIAKELPLMWKGQPIVDKWLENNPGQAAALCESAVGEWLSKLRGDTWVLEWEKYRKSTIDELATLQNEAGFRGAARFDAQQVNQLIFAPEHARDSAAEILASYKGATVPRIEEILASEKLQAAEQIALVLCKRSIFLTESQVAARSLAKSILEIVNKGEVSPIPFTLNDDIIEKLATGDKWEELLPLYQKLRRLVIDYGNPNLDRILKADDVSYIELAALASISSASCRVAFETLRQSESPDWAEYLAFVFDGIGGELPLPDIDFFASCPCCGRPIKSTLSVCSECKFDISGYIEAVCKRPVSPHICTARKKKRDNSFLCPQCSTRYTVPSNGILWFKKQIIPEFCEQCGLAFPSICDACGCRLKKFSRICPECKNVLFQKISPSITGEVSFYISASESHIKAILKGHTGNILDLNVFSNVNMSLGRLLRMDRDRAFYNAVELFLQSFNCSDLLNKIEEERERLSALENHLLYWSVISEVVVPYSNSVRVHAHEIAGQMAAAGSNEVQRAIAAIYQARKKQLDDVSRQCRALLPHLPRLKSILAPDIGGQILKWMGIAAAAFVLGPVVAMIGSTGMTIARGLAMGMDGAERASDGQFVDLFSKNLYSLSVLSGNDVDAQRSLASHLAAAIERAIQSRCKYEVALLLELISNQSNGRSCRFIRSEF